MMEHITNTGLRPLTSNTAPVPFSAARGGGNSRLFRIILVSLVFLIDATAALALGWFAAEHQIGSIFVARFSSQTTPSLVQHKREGQSTRTRVMAPFIVAEDTFDRDAEMHWGQASDGLTWEGDANRSDGFFLQGGSGIITGSDESQTALLGRPLMDSEVDAQVACSRFFGGTNVGVVLRWRDWAHWDKAYLDGKRLMVIKRVGAQTMVLGSVPFVARSGVFYSLRFRAVGGQLLVVASSLGKGWATRKIVVFDPAPATLGEEGLRVYFPSREEVTAHFTLYRVYALR